MPSRARISLRNLASGSEGRRANRSWHECGCDFYLTFGAHMAQMPLHEHAGWWSRTVSASREGGGQLFGKCYSPRTAAVHPFGCGTNTNTYGNPNSCAPLAELVAPECDDCGAGPVSVVDDERGRSH